MRATTPTSRTLAVLLAGCLGTLALVGCGASGGESADRSTTTAATTTSASDDATTTSAAPGLEGDLGGTTEPVDEPDDPAGEVALDDLEAILPEASVAGPDFHSESDVEEGYDEPDDLDAAFEEHCPSAADLTDDTVDEGRVGRAFQAEDDRTLKVVLDPTPDSAFDEDRLDITIAAVQGCSPIEWTDGDVSFSADLALERNDTYGDRGVAVHLVVTVESPELPQALELTAGARAWVTGSVLVVVTSNDAVDEDTYETIPADHELVETVSADLEEQLADLVG